MVSKNRIYFIGILLISLFSLSFILASVNVGDKSHSIDTIYGPEFPIKGWVNLSFSDEPLNSLFEDSFQNNISLEDALSANPDYSYACSPSDCNSDYLASNSESEKTLNLNEEEKLVGFKLTGDITSIDSVSLDVSSDVGPLCGESQLKLDFLNDGTVEITNNKSSGNACSGTKTYGCFNPSLESKDFILDNNQAIYCEKVNISSTPSVGIGAWVKNDSGTGAITMELFDSSWTSQGECNLQTSSIAGEEVSCEVDVSVKEKEEYYACIYSDSPSGNGYEIQGYNSGDEKYCGYYGLNNPVDADYRIFIEEKEFGSFGSKSINTILPEDGTSLAIMVQDYIKNRYGDSMDCGTSGCVIPINIVSDVNQNVTLNNLEIGYSTSTGGSFERNLQDLTETPAKITSNFQKLYLDNFDFKVSDEIDTHDYSFLFNGEEIFNEEIDVKDAPIIRSLNPTKTASFIPITFTITLDSNSNNSNISHYKWNFGDNTTGVTTLKNTTTHTYNSTGEYFVNVSVTDNKNLTSEKSFLVDVDLPVNFINSKLSELNSSVSSIEEDISELSIFQRQGIRKILNLSFVESEIERIQELYDEAENASDYIPIVNDLAKLDLPEKIVKTKETENLTFIPQSENVDLEIIRTIGGGEYSGRENAYKDAVTLWQHQNLITKIGSEEFSGEYEESRVPLVNFFEISISEKSSIDYPYYFIVPKMGNVEIQGISREETNHYYKDISRESRISFYTTEELDSLNPPIFMSPSLNRLTVNEELVGEYEAPSRILWVVAAFAVLAILAIFIYLILKEWYKRRYESSLFKDRNDLYNMVNYVNNAKKKDLKDDEIRKNLKDAGWSNERIRYVMKKYGGKNTGMFELPVDKIVKKVSKK